MEQISKEKAEELYYQFSNYIFKVAFLFTHSQSLSDDITQETLIRIFKYYHTYDESKPIKPWIYKITLNTLRELKRKQKWLVLTEHLPVQKDSEESFENKLIRRETNDDLLDAVNKLPNKYKEIIVLYYFEEFTLKEIAEILSIPLGTCKSRLHNAIKKLNRKFNVNLYLGGQSL
jgi:RNA polymerase sigma factor (sigma-70 family)